MRQPPPSDSATGGALDPFSAMNSARDRDVMRMVELALHEGRTALAYQPVILARDQEKVAFHEGLIRILDPGGRVIPARDFISQVEMRETGRLIDCAALRMGLSVLRDVPDLRLSINMSARSIGYARWLRVLHDGLDADPTVGERLILEITESSAMLMPDVVTAFMDELQSRGIAFALDDFGAGFTAFRYFRDFMFDVIKIDSQFIQNVAGNPDNQVLTRALTSIGQHFDMLIVAEAVETREDADWLIECGVDCLQGYLYSPPVMQPGWLPTGARRVGGIF